MRATAAIVGVLFFAALYTGLLACLDHVMGRAAGPATTTVFGLMVFLGWRAGR